LSEGSSSEAGSSSRMERFKRDLEELLSNDRRLLAKKLAEQCPKERFHPDLLAGVENNLKAYFTMKEQCELQECARRLFHHDVALCGEEHYEKMVRWVHQRLTENLGKQESTSGFVPRDSIDGSLTPEELLTMVREAEEQTVHGKLSKEFDRQWQGMVETLEEKLKGKVHFERIESQIEDYMLTTMAQLSPQEQLFFYSDIVHERRASPSDTILLLFQQLPNKDQLLEYVSHPAPDDHHGIKDLLGAGAEWFQQVLNVLSPPPGVEELPDSPGGVSWSSNREAVMLRTLKNMGHRFVEANNESITDWIYFGALLMMYDLRNHIANAVSKCRHPDISTVKQVIKDLGTRFSSKEKCFLEPWKSETKQSFKGMVFFHCKTLLVQRKKEVLETTIQTSLQHIDTKRGPLRDNINRLLSVGLDDAQAGSNLAELVQDSVRNTLSERARKKHVERWRSRARMTPLKFHQMCIDTAFDPATKGSDVFLYINSFPKFTENVFKSFFDKVIQEERETTKTTMEKEGKDVLLALCELATVFEDMCDNYPSWDRHAEAEEVRKLTSLIFLHLINNSSNTKQLSDALTGLNAVLELDGSSKLQLPPLPRSVSVLREARQQDVGMGEIMPCVFDDPVTFAKAFVNSLSNFAATLELDWVEDQPQVAEEQEKQLLMAKGCTECCPFCGAQCNVPILAFQDEQHPHQHTAEHRIAGFQGHYELLEDGSRVFITDACDSPANYLSHWIPKDQSCMSDSSIIERAQQHGAVTSGSLTIFLSWANLNDLDLEVECPSGELINLNHRESACGGKLDLDMNRIPHVGSIDWCHKRSEEPVESIYWDHGVPQGTFKISVKYFQAVSQKEAQRPTDFKVQIKHSPRDERQGMKVHEHTGSVMHKQRIHVADYQPALDGIPFPEYCKKTFPQWDIPCCLDEEEGKHVQKIMRQKKALKKAKVWMEQKYRHKDKCCRHLDIKVSHNC